MSSDSSSEQRLQPDSVLAFLRESARRPISLKSLRKELDVDDAQRGTLEAALQQLVDAGRVVQTREGRYGIPEKMNLVVGRLSSHPDGYGFVIPDDKEAGPDVFIPGRKNGEGLHGDRVVARIEHVKRDKRREGRIIRVLERARHAVVGKLERSKGVAYVSPLDPKLGYDVTIPPGELNGAEDGQIVHAEITSYPSGKRGPEGKVQEVLGQTGDPKVDVEVIIREFGLPHSFPEEIQRQAESVPTEVSEEEVEGRTDFRDLPIVTIDGESAEDFDDAVHVEVLDNGHFKLHVHIADVAHYVPVGSAIDQEAERRATSVYFPGKVVPMLPEALSNQICSLRPQVDRLVHSVLMEIDHEGRTLNYEFHDGVIHSAARMTYRQVAHILDPEAEVPEEHEPLADQFRNMERLARALMRHRRQRGSLDFDLPDPQLVMNIRGEVEDIIKEPRNIAHRIIEEFMIRANEVVASHLIWEQVPAMYRVHEGPDPERVEQFREFISGLGHTLEGGEDVRPEHFSRLLERVAGRPEERVISMLMLRTMKQARYRTDNDGHFGLASQRYTHFTSPIRRYPDLMIHRMLRADRGSEAAEGLDADAMAPRLEGIARHCSVQEREAEQAERDYVDWKKVKFMADKAGEEYEGYITGVQSFGLFIELEPWFVEGLVPISSLGDDYYHYDEAKHRLRGENTGRTFTLGDRVKVTVAKVDLERRRMDFHLEEGPLPKPEPPPKVEEEEDAPSAKKGRGRRRGRGGRGKDKGRGKRGSGGDGEEAGGEDRKASEGNKEGGSGRSRRRGRRRRGGGKSGGGKSGGGRSGGGRSGGGRSGGGRSGGGKSDAGKSDAGKSRGKSSGGGKQGDSGSRRGRGGGRQQRDDQRASGDSRDRGQQQKKDGKDKAKVNPYLTDIDL